jgi:subtilisin family serine protease
VDVVDETGWGLLDIHADSVWNLGYSGQGVIVGLLDTGMDYNHPDLRDRVWVNPGEDLNGNGLVDSSDWNGIDDDSNGYVDDLRGWDFFYMTPEVMDYTYNGTQSAGIILGDGSGVNVTGVAPQAKAMILKCVNGTMADFMEAEQYAILMNADLINSSLIFKWNWWPPPDYAAFRQAEAALLAAGLVHSCAMGFEGLNQILNPIPFNIPAPANCPAPWFHPSQTLQGGITSVLASGAYDAGHQLRDSSSLGPSVWNLPEILSLNPSYPWTATWPDSFNDYPWRQGQNQGLIKPDLAAPTGVISDHPGGSYSIAGGTLAASAHTAGTLALLLSAYPQADPAMLARIIMSTAVDSGAPGKDNRWGAGRLDAYAAMTELLSELGVVPPENEPSSPAQWRLYPAHPNPFNSSTALSYQLSAYSHVNLRVFDLTGKLVRVLEDNWQAAGRHEVTFDGSGLSSGIYFVRMQAGEFTQSRKLVLLK